MCAAWPILLRRNYTVIEARNGKEALEFLRQEAHYNLIILDLEMPELSGTQDKQLVSRVLKHGASDYMSKPFAAEELLLKCQTPVGYHDSKVKLSRINQDMQAQIALEVRKAQEQGRLL